MDSEIASERPVAKPRDPNRWVMIIGLGLTFVSSAAAAIGAAASLHSLNQSQQVLLLQKRVDACFELRRQAATEFNIAVKVIQDPDEWYYGGGHDSNYDSWGWTDVTNCSGTKEKIAECERELEEKAVIRRAENEQIARLAASARRLDARLQYETSRTFTLLASPNLAEAENTLNIALTHLSNVSADRDAVLKDGASALDTAVRAFEKFNAACISAVDAYKD